MNIKGGHDDAFEIVGNEFFFFLHMNIQMYSFTFIIFAAIFFPMQSR